MSRQLGSIGYLLWQQDLVPFLSKSSYTQKQGVQTSFIWVQTFNIASEASYVYILNGQKLIENAKICPLWRVFENLKFAVKQRYQTGHF